MAESIESMNKTRSACEILSNGFRSGRGKLPYELDKLINHSEPNYIKEPVKQKLFTISELVGLDGLPKTSQGILKKAKREKWNSYGSKGKASLYYIGDLPNITQKALVIKLLNKEIESEEQKEKELKEMNIKNEALIKEIEKENKKINDYYFNGKNQELNSLQTSNKHKMKRIDEESIKLIIRAKLETILEYQLRKKNYANNRYYEFCHEYNNNKIFILNWVKKIIPKLSWRDFKKWCDFVSIGDLLSLGK